MLPIPAPHSTWKGVYKVWARGQAGSGPCRVSPTLAELACTLQAGPFPASLSLLLNSGQCASNKARLPGNSCCCFSQSLPSAWMRESEGLQILGARKRQGRLDVAQGVTRLSSSTSKLRGGVIIQVFIQQMSVELLLCAKCYSRSLGGMNVLNRRSPCSHGANILEGGNGE